MTYLVYPLIAVLFFFPLLIHLNSHILTEDAFTKPGYSDSYNSLWTYWWIQKAVTHLKNPFYCDEVLPPTGADLMYDSQRLIPTIITLPFGVVLGPVAGYNLMLLALLTASGFVFRIFCRDTLGCSKTAATIGGFLFAFLPYFAFKAHTHPNLINGAIWGGCLAALWHSYLGRVFTWRNAFLFSILFWASLWTSFVEFYMLSAVILLSVFVLEITQRRKPYDLCGRLRFVVALLSLGLVAVTPILIHGLPLSELKEVLFRTPTVRELFMPPRLHFLSANAHSQVPEFWGITFPISCLLPALVGMVAGLAVNDRRFPRRVLFALMGVALFTGFLCLGGVVGQGIQSLTNLTSGFRVYARFFPFLMFFACALAAIGVDLILAQRILRKPVLAGLLLLASFEYYPFLLCTSPVLQPRIPRVVLDSIVDGRFIMYLPNAPLGRKLSDTFQVAVDKPVVHLSPLGREPWSVARLRDRGFPRTYGGYWVELSPEWYDEAKRLNIGYVYVEDKTKLEDLKIPYETLYVDDSCAFVKLP